MAGRAEASGRRGGSVVVGVLTVCEAIAVAVQLQDVDVMVQPIEQRRPAGRGQVPDRRADVPPLADE